MDKDELKTKMYRAQKGPVRELNGCITCRLCKGYFIDATTIIECLHTFCRSCIVKYLASNKYCPICDVQVHKTKPLLNIRRDKTIQDLVYKLVPRLYQNEAKRRKIFYEGNPAATASLSEESTASHYDYILAPDETINLTLNYHRSSSAPRYLRSVSFREACLAMGKVAEGEEFVPLNAYHIHPRIEENIRARDFKKQLKEASIRERGNLKNIHGRISARYLRCPSAVSILHLKKLIQAKYELTDRHKVDIFYNQDVLQPSLSLMDIAYIYSWKKKETLDLTYKIYECRAKKPKLDESTESSANNSANNNNNNWKEVQLRISENGEMSITGIQDAGMLDLLDATENFKSEVVINESKHMDTYVNTEIGDSELRFQAGSPKTTESISKETADTPVSSTGQLPLENHLPACKKDLPGLKFIGKTSSGGSSTTTTTKPVANSKLLNSGIKMVINNAKSGASNGRASPDVIKSTYAVTTSSTDKVASAPTVGKTAVSKVSRASITESKTSKNLMSFNSSLPKSIELSETLNLNSELSVIPLNANVSCVSLSSCGGTTTVFSTINKSMCSTKSDESYTRNAIVSEGLENNSIGKEVSMNSVSKQSNSLKRKSEETEKPLEVPTKLPKPTILNHSIGLMNLSNNHPLKKHAKMNRNGERRNAELSEKITISSPSLTVSHVLVNQKPTSLDNPCSKPLIINKNLGYLQLNRCGSPKLTPGQKSFYSGNVPCYMPKISLNSTGKVHEKNGEKTDVIQDKNEVSTHNAVSKSSGSHTHGHAYQNTHHTPIITPAQLPHHQNLNSLQLKVSPALSNKEAEEKQEQENEKTDQNNLPTNLVTSQASITVEGSQSNTQSGSAKTAQKASENNAEPPSQAAQNQALDMITSSCASNTTTSSIISNSHGTTIKTKPSTPIGYKTLRDPPKSWNSQINSQIARVNQNVKAQQMANAAAAAAAASQGGGTNAQGRYAGDLKSVRPAKFFKGRNMPRYLGNPASGVKPMYQVHVSPEKDKNQEQHAQNSKAEKSEIKKHSIVKIDPKTLKPISEKAPETSNLSNITSNLGFGVTQNNQELRLNLSGDLRINTSSVSIFNPLKLQQNSPKNDRRSPKSPHSPKVKSHSSSNTTAVTMSNPSNSLAPNLSPKQQREKTSLTFTPSNPFVPNLASPTLNPNQFLYPAGGFPSYDPRFMAACHRLWYTQRMAAAAAAGLVPPPLPHAFGLNIGLNTAATSGQQQQQHSPGVSPKHSTSTKAASQTSPRSSSTAAPPTSKHSPTSTARKLKESSLAKNDKSLETALEKLTQHSKVKDLSGNKQPPGDSKSIRNGSPLRAAQRTPPTVSNNESQEKASPNDVAVNMSALEKLTQNKAIEILGTSSGKRSPAVQQKTVASDGSKRVTAIEGHPTPPLAEKLSNTIQMTAPASPLTSKNDNTEPSSPEKNHKSPPSKDQEQKTDSKPMTLTEDKRGESIELLKRLGQPESENTSESKKEQATEEITGETNGKNESSLKCSSPSDGTDKAKSDQKQSSDRCTNSSETPGDNQATPNITRDTDVKSLECEPSKSGSSETGNNLSESNATAGEVVSKTSPSDVLNGGANADESSSTNANENASQKPEDVSQQPVPANCDSVDDGKETNTV